MITPKAVIFDMDGLMFDTERLAVDAWLHAGRELNLPITTELIYSVIGVSWERHKSIWRCELGEIDFNKANAICHDYMNLWIETNGIPVKPGLIELLSFLDENDIEKAIATGSERSIVDYYLGKACIDGSFPVIVTGESVGRSKPDPGIFLHAAKLLNTDPKDCIVLEDSINGIKAAHAADMTPIMIPDLIQSTEETELLIYAKLDSLTDVVPLLKGLL